jgi:hypothetical protein
LFRPATAWRVRRDTNTGTPLSPDEPAAPNPPDGVVFSYLLGAHADGPVTLEVLETATGQLFRRFSSEDPPDLPVPLHNAPGYWLRPPQRLAATPGLHRFVWNLRFAPPAVDRFTYPLAAVPHDTPKVPEGLWVLPGVYQVRLTVGGRVFRQAVMIKMDPRVKTPSADLALQFQLSKALDDAMRQIADARAALVKRRAGSPGDAGTPLDAAMAALDSAYPPLPELFSTIQEADVRPTASVEAATAGALKAADAAVATAREVE